MRSFPSSVHLSSCFFFHFSLLCWFNLFWNFSIYISVLTAIGSECGIDFRSYQPCSSTKVDFVHLIYDFFVPPHKNEIFFCFSYQSFVLFRFIYISVSAATSSESGMDFEAPRWDLFLPLFDCPHGFLSIFHFSVDLIFSGVFPSTFQFLQQPVVEVEWDFRSYSSFVSASRWNLFLP